MTKRITEDTISAIVSAANDLAADTEAVRENLDVIAAELRPILTWAGVKFGSADDSTWWESGTHPDLITCRIGIRTQNGSLMLGVEKTQLYPSEWNGSEWIGHEDPFDDDAYSTHAASIVPFSATAGKTLSEVVERLPRFIAEYAEELSRQRRDHAELKAKSDRIRAILETI